MNNEIFNTKNELSRRIQSNILFVAFVDLAIYTVGLRIMYTVQRPFNFFTPLVGEKYSLYYNANFWLIIPILMLIAFMWLTCRNALSVFTEGTMPRKLGSLAKGLLIGFAMNGLLCLLAGLSHTIEYSFNEFEPLVLPLIFFVFIQCTAEEVLLRGYVPAILGPKHTWDAVAFVSGALFIFHHELNMQYYGFNSIFCLNVFLIGVFLCLLIKWDGNFWIACGFHTAWNYMQFHIFGLSNSGNSPSVCIFKGANSATTFFFDYVYGFEGSLCATLLITAGILLLIWKMKLLSDGLSQGRFS